MQSGRKIIMHKIRTVIRECSAVLGALLMLAMAFGSPPEVWASTYQKGYRIAHRGQVDTDLQFSEFFNGPFTISAWVMPEFTYNDVGAIFGVKGSGRFFVGQADYRLGNGDFKRAGDPVLFVNVNGMIARYLACPGKPSPSPCTAKNTYKRRSWNHIAVVRAGWKFELYLNGQRLTAFTKVDTGKKDANGNPIYKFDPAQDVTFSSSISYTPTDKLRLGRADDPVPFVSVLNNVPQFYGLIDDVAVYNKAMTSSEILSLRDSPGISGSHPNLVAGWKFNRLLNPSPKLTRPVYPNNRAFLVPTSDPKIVGSDADAWIFDNPFYISPSAVARRLPFKPGQIWSVIQEFDSRGGSHNGYAAFCWDFGRVDGPTANETFIAAAPGKIFQVTDAGDAFNLKVLPNEHDTYMHLVPKSVWDLIAKKGYLFVPKPSDPTTWVPVSQDEPLAKVDPVANHLHYCANNSDTFITIPTALWDYEVSKDGGKTWEYVPVGMPRAGQWVRRPK